MLVPGKYPGMIDLVLWIVAFVCFLIAAFVGERLAARVDLIALGLAAASLTFII
jgi:hypothetical protein